MSTDKRDRQRANRASRIAAAEERQRRRRNRNRLIVYGSVGLLAVVAVVLVVVLTGGDDAATETDGAATDDTTTDDTTTDDTTTDDTTTDDTAFVYGSGECPPEDGSDSPVLEFGEPPAQCIDPASDYVATFDTSEGEIVVDLDTASVPGTVNNFVTLARWGYYDDTLLFRTDPSIAIIQGGSPHTNSPADPGPGYTISDEPPFTTDSAGTLTGPYRYEPGQLVMARSAGTDSAGAQFFFTTGPEAANLDSQGIYVVFGTTDASGLGVLESIIALHVPGESLGGSPSREVTVNSVTIEEL